MTKKILIPIISISILILIFIGWHMNTYSKADLPYPKIPETGQGKPSFCLQSVANELVIMRNDWNANLQQLKEQQKPCSAKVDEAYESMRTYRCWLDYLCQAVEFSGTASPDEIKDAETKGIPFGANLFTMPGCVSGDKIIIPGTKIKFLPYCNVSTSASQKLQEVGTNIRECRNLVLMEFADPKVAYLNEQSSDAVKKIKEQSAGMVALESFLKNCNANQKGLVLQDKLQSILLKMHGMESHVDLLREYLERFDAKLPCVAPKCD